MQNPLWPLTSCANMCWEKKGLTMPSRPISNAGLQASHALGFLPYDGDASGEDLGWFWRGWILNNWKLDQGVKEVKYAENDPSKGSFITLENLEEMAMPVVLAIQQRMVQKIPLRCLWKFGRKAA